MCGGGAVLPLPLPHPLPLPITPAIAAPPHAATAGGGDEFELGPGHPRLFPVLLHVPQALQDARCHPLHGTPRAARAAQAQAGHGGQQGVANEVRHTPPNPTMGGGGAGGEHPVPHGQVRQHPPNDGHQGNHHGLNALPGGGGG